METVTLYVGYQKQPFLLHKKVLCDRSVYFSKAFNNGMQETQDSTMHLLTDDPAVFNHIVDYLYRGTIIRYPNKEFPKDAQFPDPSLWSYMYHLFGVYGLAEKFCMNNFQNEIMDLIQDTYHAWKMAPDLFVIRLIYPITHEQSKLRLYITVLFSWYQQNLNPDDPKARVEISTFEDVAREIPDFVFAHLKVTMNHGNKLRDGWDPRARNDGVDACIFHTHTRYEVCHSKK